MDIVKATPGDLPLLRDFAEYTFRRAYEADNDQETFETYCREAFKLEKFEKEMLLPNSTFFLAYEKDELAGYLKLNFDKTQASVPPGKAMQLERIYVSPAFQGKGRGRELLDFVLEQARQSGSEWIWLSVWKENPAAIRFYEQNGYQICGIEIFYLADDPQEDWVMLKSTT